MNLFGSQEVLGLDIGRRYIKAVVMRKGAKGAEVLNASLVRIDSTPQQNEEARRKKVFEALKKALAEFGKKPRRVALACPGPVVFPRIVKLPPVAKGKLKQIVQYETQQQIPFSLEEVIWDYYLLPNKGKGKAEMSALILAVKKDIVQDILSLALSMKLEVELLGFTPLAIYNTLQYTGDILEDKAAAIIDIGAQSTDITVVEDGEIAMVRPIPFGGNSFTQAIASSFEIDFREAEEIKEREAFISATEEGITGEKQRKLFSALQPVMDELLDEIRRSIGYYRSQLRGSNISNLILTGGGVQLKNIDKFIEGNLRIKVIKTNPFIKMPLPGSILSKFPEPCVFSVALGLGLRLLGEGKIKINLLPEHVLQRVEFRKKEPVLIASFVLVLLSVLVYAGIIRQKTSREEVVLKGLNNAIANYTNLEKTLKPKRKEKQKLLRRISEFQEISRERTFWLDIFNEVAYLIPDGIILESFSPAIKEAKKEVAAQAPKVSSEFAGLLGERAKEKRTKQVTTFEKGIKLEGLSPSFGMISDFISHLEVSPMIKKVDVDPSSGQLVKLPEGEFVKFVLAVEITEEAF